MTTISFGGGRTGTRSYTYDAASQGIISADGEGGAATGATAAVAAGLAGAAGSVVSQGFGVATGIQDRFSFKQVALAASAGGVSGASGRQGAGVKGACFCKVTK